MLKKSRYTYIAAIALASWLTALAPTYAASATDQPSAAQSQLPDFQSTLASQSQQAIKSTNTESITIEVKNTPNALEMASNEEGEQNSNGEQVNLASTNLAQGNAETQARPTVDAEQIGLFRIYRSNLLKLTYQHVIYPESAIDRNQQGNVVLMVTINREGKVQGIKFKERAEFNSLNKAARKAVDNAKGSFPSAPKRLRGESFEVTMPIKFRLSS